jgi:hypothetical protein
MDITGNSLFNRFACIAPEVEAEQALIHIQRAGDRLLFSTGQRYIRQTRLFARVVGALGVPAGIALAQSTPWGWALVALGVLVCAFIPRMICPSALLEIDGQRGQVLVAQGSAGAGTVLDIARITELRGSYETQGWDPRSVLYAALEDGTQTPILVFQGTDEPLAEYACRTIGLLLNRTATYAGPFGGVKICYERR